MTIYSQKPVVSHTVVGKNNMAKITKNKIHCKELNISFFNYFCIVILLEVIIRRTFLLDCQQCYDKLGFKPYLSERER